MNKKLIPLLLASTALIAGCDKLDQTSGSAAPVVKKEDAVAVVNGRYISKDSLQLLENEIAERSHGQTFPKDKLIEELVRRELLVQDALNKQLDKSPDFQARMEQARRSLLSQADLQDFLKSNPVTDEEIKAEYDKSVAGENGQEYKARHILVKTEEEAKKLIEELNSGAKFEELAKKNSTGPSGPQGGDLGWFAAGQMVAPFSEAVIALENGKYTLEPVQTQFGWHVILREDSRAQAVPAMEAVKEQLQPFLQRQKVQNMLEALRTQAKVEIFEPVTEKAQAVAADTATTKAPAESNDSIEAGQEQPATEPAPAAADKSTTEPAPAATK
ncbi:MAG: peptidylprolyl isomerase [Gammaproteobacteria bacterium HGW-Gammaproteobacteria-3]|nr:MAG: peptidylprolyl isomerase [Gammaproteobacteria bacterium HGW-Gammaproteobacteria-3]